MQTNRRAKAKLQELKKKRAKPDAIDGLVACGAFLFGGAAVAADFIRRNERARCRRLVADRSARDPELIQEILDDIDREKP